MKITHHENGDSEYEFPVKVRKGCSDGDGTSVQIGYLLCLNISERENGVCIELLYNGDSLKDGFESKEEALGWILERLGK